MDLDSPSSDLVSSDLFDHQFRYNGEPILKLDDEERLPIVPTVAAGAGEWCEAHRDRAGVDVPASFIVNCEAFCADCYRGKHVHEAELAGDSGDEREAANNRAYNMRRRKERPKCVRPAHRAFAPRISRKTHCVNGHPLEGENIRVVAETARSGARRICRACGREKMRKFNLRRRRLEIDQVVSAAAA